MGENLFTRYIFTLPLQNVFLCVSLTIKYLNACVFLCLCVKWKRNLHNTTKAQQKYEKQEKNKRKIPKIRKVKRRRVDHFVSFSVLFSKKYKSSKAQQKVSNVLATQRNERERGIRAAKGTENAKRSNNANAFCHALINHNLRSQNTENHKGKNLQLRSK